MAIYSPNPDGSILTVGGRGARVRLAKQITTEYRPQSGVKAVCFSPNGQLLASASKDGSIKLWRLDGATSSWIPDRKLSGDPTKPVSSIAFHPKRDDLLLSAGDDGVRLWQPAAGGWSSTKLQNPNRSSSPIFQAIFSPPDKSGACEILAVTDHNVNSWGTDGKPLGSLTVDSPQPLRCLAVSPDRKWLVAGAGSEVWVWNQTAPQEKPLVLRGHATEINALTFSPDGERLFTAGGNKQVKVWDAKSWAAADKNQPAAREVLTLEEHTNSVVSLTFYPSTKNPPALLSAGADGQAILWPSLDWH